MTPPLVGSVVRADHNDRAAHQCFSAGAAGLFAPHCRSICSGFVSDLSERERGVAPELPGLPEALGLIASRAAEHDVEGTFPFEAFDALFPTGALRLTIPVDAGGLGGGLADGHRVWSPRSARPIRPWRWSVSQHLLMHADTARGWRIAVLDAVRRSSLEGVALINALPRRARVGHARARRPAGHGGRAAPRRIAVGGSAAARSTAPGSRCCAGCWSGHGPTIRSRRCRATSSSRPARPATGWSGRGTSLGMRARAATT